MRPSGHFETLAQSGATVSLDASRGSYTPSNRVGLTVCVNRATQATGTGAIGYVIGGKQPIDSDAT